MEQGFAKVAAGKALQGVKEIEYLWTTLRISYDDLQEEVKDLFLDIACFFSCDSQLNEEFISVITANMGVRIAIRLWRSQAPEIGLLNLKERSLVKVTKDGALHMHDQLLGMGRSIMKDLAEKSLEQVS